MSLCITLKKPTINAQLNNFTISLYLQICPFSFIYHFWLITLIINILIHSSPMHPFSTPWKHQKTLWYFYIFRGWKKGPLGTNGLNLLLGTSLLLHLMTVHFVNRFCNNTVITYVLGNYRDLYEYYKFRTNQLTWNRSLYDSNTSFKKYCFKFKIPIRVTPSQLLFHKKFFTFTT